MIRNRVVWAIVFALGCGGEEGASDGPATLFDPGVDRVVLELDVQQGAEPRFDGSVAFGTPWDLVEQNMQALFEGREVVVPGGMADAELLAIDADSFSAQDISDIADAARDGATSDREVSLYLLFLDGYFREQGIVHEEVLGVTIRSRGIIAMFSPSLRAQGTTGQAEQVAIVHEIGHAIGLVDAGISMVTDHLDRSHGNHCDNPRCVMDYRYEGGGDELSIDAYGSGVLFGSECLDDVYAAFQE